MEVQKLYDVAEEARQLLLDQLSAEDLEQSDIDCRKGCYHCCGMIVKPTTPELFIILNHILKEYSQEEIDELMGDLRLHNTRCDNANGIEERVKVYCSFLKDNVCSIESVKPLSCRAYTSTNVNSCKAFVQDPSLDIPISVCHYSPYDMTRKAILKSLYFAGFNDVTEELNSGMLRLLEEEFG